ncbi:probable glutathione S-transferase isoform X3 [Helianthus annuus]|uniref:probable glutathione S-transferase isoform X3 n=1 Tax=Helianthus annuus TaxID=4232 RepID=UPI000B8FC306|nr:probable glutathione S-transferase isoform X3 [Helianthus annuus]
MADELKLYAASGSPFVFRVELAFILKGVTYKTVEENIKNKSADLLKYNPVYKQVPVLVHNGNPIPESLVIIEYIDDVWKGYPILPQDPYEKSVVRFWAKFIDSTVFGSNGAEHAIAEAHKQLQVVENKLAVEGNKFFGGDNINLIDIAASFIAYWLGMLEEGTGIKFVPKDKFPKITEWADNFLKVEVVKDVLPPRVIPPKAQLLAFFKQRFGDS